MPSTKFSDIDSITADAAPEGVISDTSLLTNTGRRFRIDSIVCISSSTPDPSLIRASDLPTAHASLESIRMENVDFKKYAPMSIPTKGGVCLLYTSDAADE